MPGLFDEYDKTAALFERRFGEMTDGLREIPQPLLDSMRYSLKTKGKRLRPVLFIRAALLLGRETDDAVLDFAAAIETLHNYTLVHDDLPALDNDDYRRGRLTNHRVFGEDIALLCGDALLNRAYELVFSAIERAGNAPGAIRAGALLCRLCGAAGLIGGQTLDVAKPEEGAVSEEVLRYVFRHKTADLIAASVLCGALYADAADREYAALERFAYAFGFAFQLADDLLDKDSENRGMSALDIYPEAEVRRRLDAYTAEALAALADLPRDTSFFAALAGRFKERTI
ncbi:MAG: polyprenyl synthetase family protein [Clostridiales bacterium]|jgi:geranylgeranyl diphosphate synthase type II|nr:polyprenyl synthetase family protein [Clostridiales bacterium]